MDMSGFKIFYGRMISFLLASLVIKYMGVLLTCYSPSRAAPDCRSVTSETTLIVPNNFINVWQASAIMYSMWPQDDGAQCNLQCTWRSVKMYRLAASAADLLQSTVS